MPRTGSYAKGTLKREEILRVALEMIGEKGYNAATIRELAQAVGLSKTGLLHHFGTKEELFTEILKRRDAMSRDESFREALGRDDRAYASDLLKADLSSVLRRNIDVAGLVQLYARFQSEATDPGHMAHAYFRDRINLVRSELAGAFEEMRSEGVLPSGADPTMCAVILFAAMDGLQTHWLFEPELDMAKHVKHLIDLIAQPPASTEDASLANVSETPLQARRSRTAASNGAELRPG